MEQFCYYRVVKCFEVCQDVKYFVTACQIGKYLKISTILHSLSLSFSFSLKKEKKKKSKTLKYFGIFISIITFRLFIIFYFLFFNKYKVGVWVFEYQGDIFTWMFDLFCFKLFLFWHFGISGVSFSVLWKESSSILRSRTNKVFLADMF